jgi:hypothetical protein
MVKPTAYREAVGFLQSEFEFSERRACSVVGHARSSCRYVARRTMVLGLLDELRQDAVERPRFGYRRLHVLLRRRGWRVVVACLIVTFLLATAPTARALPAPPTDSHPAPTIFVDALAGSFIVSLIVLTCFLVRPKTFATQKTAVAPTALGPRTGVDLRRLDVDGDPGEFTIAGGDALAVWHF